MNALFAGMLLAIVVGFAGLGHALRRADRLQAAHNANAANLRLVRAELEQLRVRAYMTPEQPRTAVDQLCRDRVEALRDGIRVLQRVGKVELEDFPGWGWSDDELWGRSR